MIRFAFWTLAFCLLTILTGPASLVRAERDVDGLEELLPHGETIAERLIWLGREDQMPGRDRVSDPPPVGPLRNCAEWEPCTGVLIRYPLGLPYELLRDLDDDVILHVIVSSTYLSSAQTNLAANGVDLDRVEFLIRDNDSIWTRDYGPWFVFDGQDELAIIDHTYNRPWRPNDNLIPVYFGQQQGIPSYSHDMYHTGGNYMTDGAHISSSTQLVYDEAWSANGMTAAEVDQLMSDYYGIDTYQVLPYIESGGIHHIDTWAKFLDEENVLLKSVWSTHWTYDTLEQRATLLASLPASTGRNYNVHRVYCHDIGSNRPASYTNSLILNQTIYVPLFGHATYDAQALQAYAEAAPGYQIHGYAYGGWLTDDALHCRAKGMMDPDMLRIGHVPVSQPQIGTVPIWAHVHAHSGEAVTSVSLNYRQDGGDWLSVPMASTSEDTFRAEIPAPLQDSVTEYYLHASDATGHIAGMPRSEPAHWYQFDHVPVDVTGVLGDPWRGAVTLHGNHPNPFNPATVFSFELHHAEHVDLTVCDLRGRVVRRLVSGNRPAGRNEIRWDGRDDQGRELPAAVYIFRLRAAGMQYSRPATLLK